MTSAPSSAESTGGEAQRRRGAGPLSGYLFQRVGTLRFNLLYLAPAVALLWLAFQLAWQQPLHPEPYAPRPVLSAGWWLHPIEVNAHKRWHIIDGAVHDLLLRPGDGSGELWAVGAGGLILVSRDGGQSWEQKEIAPGSPVYLADGQPPGVRRHRSAASGGSDRTTASAGAGATFPAGRAGDDDAGSDRRRGRAGGRNAGR